MLAKFRKFALAHKVVSLVTAIILITGGYYAYKDSHATVSVTKYVIQKATQGTVVASVTGSGQVQAVTSINVAPQVSETVTKVYVKVGDHVQAGQLLVQVDPTNEQKALNQAQLSLQSAQLSLEQLQQVSTTTLLQQQNAVTSGEQSLVNASTTLATDYQNGFDTLSSAFVAFQSVMAGLQDFATGNDISKTQANPDAYVSLMPNYLQAPALPYRDLVGANYTAATKSYQQDLADYNATDRNASSTTLDALFSETYNTAQAISEAVKASNDFLTYVVNNYPKNQGLAVLPSITTTFQTNLGNYTDTIDGEVSGIGSVITGLTNDKNSLISDGSSLAQASETLAETLAGPTQVSLLSQQISIQTAQNNLDTAEQNLAYTSVRAPIAGIVSAVGATVGETVASPAVSIVGEGDQAQVTLNEVDAAKVMVGDKATLTFDALPDLSLAGQVTEVDAVGTVSQGVVNYNVDIGFSQPADPNATTTADQVKPGMSVTADIVTQVDQDVVAVPNAAVVTKGGTSYVLEPASTVPDATITASTGGGVVLTPAPVQVPVTLGLANDTVTEITSGVNVGDEIITQTIVTSAAASTASTAGTSGLRLGGGTTLFGGAAGGGGFTGGGARTGAATGR
jgi:multidrug efflux pump subunit AcrA (membrane-fusion protein)